MASCSLYTIAAVVAILLLGVLCDAAPGVKAPGVHALAAEDSSLYDNEDKQQETLIEDNAADKRTVRGEDMQQQQEMIGKASFLCVPSMPACIKGRMWAEFRCFQPQEQCVCMCPIVLRKQQRPPVLPLSSSAPSMSSRQYSRRNVRNVRNVAHLLTGRSY